jgi:hypothetical protein
VAAPGGSHARQRPRGHDDARRRVRQQERDARAGQARLERHVRTARLQHRQDRDHALDGLRREEADERARRDSEPAQPVREPVRAELELAVGERRLAELERDRGGRARHLRFHQLVERGLARLRIRASRVVPLDEDPAPLALLEQRERLVASAGVGRQGREHALVHARQRGRALGGDLQRAIVEPGGELRRRVVEGELRRDGEVRLLGTPAAEHLQPAHGLEPLVDVEVREVEDRVDERLRAVEPLELLDREPAERQELALDREHAPHELVPAAGPEVERERRRIEERAEQPFSAELLRPTVDEQAGRDGALPGERRERLEVRGEEHALDGRARRAGDAVQSLHELRASASGAEATAGAPAASAGAGPSGTRHGARSPSSLAQ